MTVKRERVRITLVNVVYLRIQLGVSSKSLAERILVSDATDAAQ